MNKARFGERSTVTSEHTQRRNALLHLTRARMMGFWREPEALFWVFAFPILLALALGIAFRTQKPQPIPVAILPSASTPEIRTALAAMLELAIVEVATDDEARHLQRSGRIVVLIQKPLAAPGGESRAGPGAAAFAVVFDPSRQEARLASLLVQDTLERAAGRSDPVRIENITRLQHGSRYIDFLIPGLLGMNLMGTGMWGVGFPIASARQQKLLKRYMATPMRRSDYLLSFLLARIGWLVLEVVALVLFGRLAFGVRVTGSWVAFAGVVLLGALSFSAIGLLVVSRARTIEAVSGLMNAVMLPMWLFSGTFFSSARFPHALQWFVQALPLTAVNNALRAITNEGAGLGAMATPALVVGLWGLVSFVVAVRIFRWE